MKKKHLTLLPSPTPEPPPPTPHPQPRPAPPVALDVVGELLERRAA